MDLSSLCSTLFLTELWQSAQPLLHRGRAPLIADDELAADVNNTRWGNDGQAPLDALVDELSEWPVESRLLVWLMLDEYGR